MNIDRRKLTLIGLVICAVVAFLITGLVTTRHKKSKDTPKETEPVIKTNVDAPDYQTLYEANRITKLVKMYETMEYHEIGYYNDKENNASDGDTSSTFIGYKKNSNGIISVFDEHPEYGFYFSDNLYVLDNAGNKEYCIYPTGNVSAYDYDANCVLGTKDDGSFQFSHMEDDKYIYTKETILDADTSKNYARWSALEGDKAITTLRFASDDYRCLSVEYKLVINGKENIVSIGDYSYRNKLHDYPIKKQYDESDKVKVTVKYIGIENPDSVFNVPKGCKLSYICQDGYALYKSETENNKYSSANEEPLSADITLFCKTQ